MKFRRTYRGDGRHTYTIARAKRYMVDGLQEYDRGLHAEFVRGFFDTELAQEKFSWSDEDRDLVERFLMRHPDYGHALYLDASEAGGRPVELPPSLEEQDGAVRVEKVCIAWEDEGEGESTMCGRPVIGDSEFCAKHAPAFAEAEGA